MGGTAEGAAKARDKRKVKAQAAYEAADDCRPLIAGIDTLNLTTRAALKSGVVLELKELREKAMQAKKAKRKSLQPTDLPRWRSEGFELDFEVQPYGTRKGLVLLTTEHLVLVLNPDGPRNFPRAYVELKAPFLWAGWENAAAAAERLMGSVCNVVDAEELDVQVSRIDLACDFMGWTPEPELLDEVFGRVVRRDLQFEWGEHEHGEKERPLLAPWVRPHHVGRRFTGFTFGGGQMLARLYDKTVEIQRSRKDWFKPLWQGGGWVDEASSGNVWRLEYQIRREPLTKAEVVSDGDAMLMKSWSDVKRGLDPLWQYLMSEWLTYRLPRSAEDRKRLHPRWQRLMGATFCPQPAATLHRHHQQIQLERCTGALAGYLAREVALSWKDRGVTPSKQRFDADVAQLLQYAMDHFDSRHEVDFYEAARHRWQQSVAWAKLFNGGRAKA